MLLTGLLLASMAAPALPAELEGGSSSQIQGWNPNRNASTLPLAGNSYVYLHTGELCVTKTDLTLPGRNGHDFRLERTYRSQYDYPGRLGACWDHNWSEFVALVGGDPEFLYVYRGEQRRSTFFKRHPSRQDLYLPYDGDGLDPAVPPEGGCYEKILLMPGGALVRRDRSGDMSFYHSLGAQENPGKLHSRRDRFGNAMEVVYDAQGRIDKVLDTYDREILFNYDSQDRLSAVQDFTGRTISYRYDGEGNLSKVTWPKITGTPSGNDFPDGTSVLYRYSVQSSVDKHNLKKIYLPTDVGSAQSRGGSGSGGGSSSTGVQLKPHDVLGLPAVSVEYDEANDRIETILEGTPNGQRKAGGTHAFAYEDLGGPGVVSRTSWTDRRGKATVYSFDEHGHPLSIQDPLGHTTRFDYNEHGELTYLENPKGDHDEYEYYWGPDVFAQGNLVRRDESPWPGSSASCIYYEEYDYEPFFNQGGGKKAFFTYDYQEIPWDSNHPLYALWEAFEIDYDPADWPMGLGEVNGDGIQQAFGNLIWEREPPVTLASGDTQDILRVYTYNAFGQDLSETSGEGALTVYRYYGSRDPDGDGDPVPGSAQDPLTGGWLREVIRDVDPASPEAEPNAGTQYWTKTAHHAAISTSLEYDPVGNQTAIVDGRGTKDLYVYNQQNRLVELTRAAEVGSSPGASALGYRMRYAYDANGRIESIERENRHSSIPDTNEWIVTVYVRDILGNIILLREEVDDGKTLTTGFAYDEEGNLIQVTEPLGNYHTIEYTDRNEKWKVTQGASGADPSTLESTWDENGNLIAKTTPEGDSMSLVYAGRNGRIATSTDLAGTVTAFEYNHPEYNHPTGVVVTGSPGSGSGSVVLASAVYSYDEMGRAWQIEEEWRIIDHHGGHQLAPAPPSSTRSTQYVYDRDSQLVKMVNPNGHEVALEHDGLDRCVKQVLGAEGPDPNYVEYEYDANNNLVRLARHEMHPITGSSDKEVFVDLRIYDALDRLTRETNSMGHTTYYGYDSHDNLTWLGDANSSLIADDPLGLFPDPECSWRDVYTQINGTGNTTRFFSDGVGRQTAILRDHRAGGLGNGFPYFFASPVRPDETTGINYSPEGALATILEYDDNSRPLRYVDAGGQEVSFDRYDDQNRLNRKTFPGNGTGVDYTHDLNGNLKTSTDANGSLFGMTYDAANRLMQVDVTPAPGILGTTRQTFTWDGLSRLVKMTDDNGNGTSDDSLVHLFYDSLGGLVEEQQDGVAVASAFDAMLNRTRLFYPGGQRVLDYDYDGLERMTAIREGAKDVATLLYFGPGTARPAEQVYGNGTGFTMLGDQNEDVGYDAAGRVICKEHVDAALQILERFQYLFDRTFNRKIREQLRSIQATQEVKYDVMAYDSSYRLRDFTLLADDWQGNNPARLQTYTLGDDGSWQQLSITAPPGNTNDYLMTPGVMGQYEQFAGLSLAHDAAGNLTDDGSFLFAYDGLNRLVRIEDKGAQSVFATYAYDAAGRRTRKEVNGNTTLFLYDGEHVIEERNGSSQMQKQYVYGEALDDVLQMTRQDGSVFYLHKDGLGSVCVLTDSAGDSVEWVAYDAYGSPIFCDADGNLLEGTLESPAGNPYLFNARRYDPETAMGDGFPFFLEFGDRAGLYYYRARYMHPTLGRFMQRDPLSPAEASGAGEALLFSRIIAEEGRVGQTPYAYVNGNPSNRVDPYGLSDENRVDPMAGAKWGSFTSAVGAGVIRKVTDKGSDLVLKHTGKVLRGVGGSVAGKAAGRLIPGFGTAWLSIDFMKSFVALGLNFGMDSCAAAVVHGSDACVMEAPEETPLPPAKEPTVSYCQDFYDRGGNTGAAGAHCTSKWVRVGGRKKKVCPKWTLVTGTYTEGPSGPSDAGPRGPAEPGVPAGAGTGGKAKTTKVAGSPPCPDVRGARTGGDGGEGSGGGDGGEGGPEAGGSRSGPRTGSSTGGFLVGRGRRDTCKGNVGEECKPQVEKGKIQRVSVHEIEPDQIRGFHLRRLAEGAGVCLLFSSEGLEGGEWRFERNLGEGWELVAQGECRDRAMVRHVDGDVGGKAASYRVAVTNVYGRSRVSEPVAVGAPEALPSFFASPGAPASADDPRVAAGDERGFLGWLVGLLARMPLTGLVGPGPEPARRER